MGLEPIDNDTVALGAWRLCDVLQTAGTRTFPPGKSRKGYAWQFLDSLRDDTPPDQVRQMLPYYYKKSQG